ncbi:MAG TPA: DoxX family protein [Xanthobacteraceae bacterium]|nr:DoxX family protein [Xanthobacteraceae bacterium]
MSSATHATPAVGAAARTPSTYADLVLLVGRVLLGGIFVFSGYFKVTAVAAFAASLERRGVPYASVMGVIGAYVEFLGGLAIVLGIELRSTSALMIAFVIVATLISHRFWELAGEARGAQQTQFLKNVGIAGGFVLLHAAGGGRIALERLWRRD